MPIAPKDVKLSEIHEYLEQGFRPVAEHKDIAFQIERIGDLPRVIYTDPNRLQQILKNLLSNAFKFTEYGKVTLKFSLVGQERKFKMDTLRNSEAVLAFTVVDTGIGIPEDKQKMIFEAFHQADGTTNRKYGGTGLGLTISREIARLLGGIIEVESRPGIGSTFTLYLPKAYSVQEVVREQIPEKSLPCPVLPADADFSGKNILVIDDDMRNIFAITTVLESKDITVTYAENGRIGIQRIKDNPSIDLVLMDVMMPEMDGIEATQEIRRYSEFKSLPIISLTAKAMKGDREKCISAGASDYITKPVDPDRLLSMIYFWLNRSS